MTSCVLIEIFDDPYPIIMAALFPSAADPPLFPSAGLRTTNEGEVPRHNSLCSL